MIVQHFISTLGSKSFPGEPDPEVENQPEKSPGGCDTKCLWRHWWSHWPQAQYGVVLLGYWTPYLLLTPQIFLSFGRKVLLKFQGDWKAKAAVWKWCCLLDIHGVWIMETVQLCCHHAGHCSKTTQGVGCFPCRHLPDRWTTETGRSWPQKILGQGEIASEF